MMAWQEENEAISYRNRKKKKKKQECIRKCIKVGMRDCEFQNEDKARVWIWALERRGSSRLDLGFTRLDLFNPR